MGNSNFLPFSREPDQKDFLKLNFKNYLPLCQDFSSTIYLRTVPWSKHIRLLKRHFSALCGFYGG